MHGIRSATSFPKSAAHSAGVLALITVVASCERATSNSAGPSGGTGALPVTVATATRSDVPIEIRAVGAVEPLASVLVKPLVTGTIQEVRFEEGAEVRAGALLIQIDPRPFEAALHAAEAELARDTALAGDSEEAARQTEEALLKKSVSERAASQARANAAAAKALVRRDEAALETARLQVEYCSIRAPFDGRTGKLLVKPGSVVSANETEIVSIYQVAPIRVAFAVPEKHLSAIRQASATAQLPVEARTAGSDTPARGLMTFIDNAVDRSTGTIVLMATFPNEDRTLWPGQYVEAALQLGIDRGAVVLPARAVQSGQKGDLVFVVKPDQTVDVRPVKVARIMGNESVISEGVEEGDIVVTDGQLRLVPGARVAVQSSPATTTPAGGSR